MVEVDSISGKRNKFQNVVYKISVNMGLNNVPWGLNSG